MLYVAPKYTEVLFGFMNVQEQLTTASFHLNSHPSDHSTYAELYALSVRLQLVNGRASMQANSPSSSTDDSSMLHPGPVAFIKAFLKRVAA